MASYTFAYTIAFESNQFVADRPIMPFFKKIESLMNTRRENIIRRINGKMMRVHAYEWCDTNDSYVVIPFGKLKESNKPYGMDQETQRLIDLPQDMYDVNNLAYHARYNIAIITTNRSGPSEADIELYLNSFLPRDDEFRIIIRPIKRSAGIEQIRNAQQARSISISLDLGQPLDDFFSTEINNQQSIQGFLNGFVRQSQRNLESKTFLLTLGLGRSRSGTLDLGALLELLEAINLDASCIKEITVNYKDSSTSKVDIAKLKASHTMLRIYFDIRESRLGAEYIKNHLEGVLQENRTRYYNQIESHFSSVVQLDEFYQFVEEWDEGPAV